jgi:hypothetical protein
MDLYPILVYVHNHNLCSFNYRLQCIQPGANHPNLPIDKVIGNWLAGLIAIYLVITSIVLAVDAYKAINKFRAKKAAGAKA